MSLPRSHNDGASQKLLEERSQVLSIVNIGGIRGIFFLLFVFSVLQISA